MLWAGGHPPVFQVHGVDAVGQVVIRRQLKRRYVLKFFEKLPRWPAFYAAKARYSIGFGRQTSLASSLAFSRTAAALAKRTGVD
jgi:hypothetical protein